MPKPDGQQYVITFRKNFLKTMYCIQAIFRFLQVANVSLTNCFAFLDRSRWLHQEICSWLMIQLLCKFLRDPEKKHLSFCNQNTVHHKSENDGLRRWGSLRWSVQLFSSKKCQGRTKQHGDEHICTMMWTGGQCKIKPKFIAQLWTWSSSTNSRASSMLIVRIIDTWGQTKCFSATLPRSRRCWFEHHGRYRQNANQCFTVDSQR